MGGVRANIITLVLITDDREIIRFKFEMAV